MTCCICGFVLGFGLVLFRDGVFVLLVWGTFRIDCVGACDFVGLAPDCGVFCMLLCLDGLLVGACGVYSLKCWFWRFVGCLNFVIVSCGRVDIIYGYACDLC